mmetsp:Transcript_99857/g.242834  ORF Transcript_99857/g.242834 Transcript_99857/m.242834 type:complete len:243 (+) Transcript_99857:1279-2007(+)
MDPRAPAPGRCQTGCQCGGRPRCRATPREQASEPKSRPVAGPSSGPRPDHRGEARRPCPRLRRPGPQAYGPSSWCSRPSLCVQVPRAPRRSSPHRPRTRPEPWRPSSWRCRRSRFHRRACPPVSARPGRGGHGRYSGGAPTWRGRHRTSGRRVRGSPRHARRPRPRRPRLEAPQQHAQEQDPWCLSCWRSESPVGRKRPSSTWPGLVAAKAREKDRGTLGTSQVRLLLRRRTEQEAECLMRR